MQVFCTKNLLCHRRKLWLCKLINYLIEGSKLRASFRTSNGESDRVFAFCIEKNCSICYGFGLKLNFVAKTSYVNKQTSKRDVLLPVIC